MKPTIPLFSCSSCGAQFSKWMGRCLECGGWGTVEKSLLPPTNPTSAKSPSTDYPPVILTDLNSKKQIATDRIKTGLDELDRVLGGGLVKGSVILLGGEPGVGKSTLSTQLATLVAQTIYFTGEESIDQIKLRADRLKTTSSPLQIGAETTVEKIIATIQKHRPTLAIIDSINTLHSIEADGEAGGPTQLRASTVKLLECAKQNNTAVILIGQVTKEGTVAGPKNLEHLVDTVLYLEGDRFHNFRILRAVKNRFGSTDEIGVFSLEEDGLREVANPSSALISSRASVPGSAVACLLEGTRPLLLEIQALTPKVAFGYPQRRASGFDLNRLQVLCAVLSKRAGLPIDSHDLFLNVVGGIKADEPAADLAAVMAIASALQDKTLPLGLCAFGEVGLGGEVRSVRQTKKRLEEIKRLGFEFAVVPFSTDLPKIPGLKIAQLKNVSEILEKITSVR